MSIDTTNIPEQIIALKRRIHEQCPNMTEHFRELETILAEEIDSIESAGQNLMWKHGKVRIWLKQSLFGIGNGIIKETTPSILIRIENALMPIECT